MQSILHSIMAIATAFDEAEPALYFVYVSQKLIAYGFFTAVIRACRMIHFSGF